MVDAMNKSFARCLNDFRSDLTPWKGGAWKDEVGIEIPAELKPQPFMVFIALVHFGEFDWWGRSEKTAWEIPVTFEGIPFLLAHRKFGFYVTGLRGKLPDKETTKRMLVRLKQLIKLTDKMVEPLARQQIQAGNATITNCFWKLTYLYGFYRKKAKAAFSRKPPKAKFLPVTEKRKFAVTTFDAFKPEREGFYYSVGMVDAYFSRLEHLLIVVLPFVGFDPRSEDLQEMIGSQWSEKYKRVFDINSDRVAKKFYDRLIVIKERYRNTLSHGWFEKDGASLFFHMPVVGAIPLYLSGAHQSIHYSLFPLMRTSFEEICELFDEFDKYLRSGALKYAMKYVEAGLDSAFDEKSLRKYKEAMKSSKSFKDFIEHQSYLTDMYVNMDW